MSDIYDSDGYFYDGFNHIHETAIIGKNVDIGKGNVIMPYAVIGEAGFIRGMESKGEVVIGDDNRIGCYVNIMSGQEGFTVIGNNNLIMSHVNIGHNCWLGDDIELGAGCMMSGYVTIDSNCKLKLGTIIRNRVVLSRNVLAAMGSVIINDIPEGRGVMGCPAH